MDEGDKQDGAGELTRILARVFEATAQGLAVGDPATNRFRSVNSAFAEFLGRSAEALVGTPILDVYGPHEHERVRSLIREAESRGAVRYEADFRHADGDMRPAEVVIRNTYQGDGRPWFRLATVTDLRARREQVAKLESQKERLQNLARRLETARERDRRKFAELLTEDLSQCLAATTFALESARSGGPGTTLDLAQWQGMLSKTMEEIRRLAWTWRPAMLAGQGLSNALDIDLDAWGQRLGIAVAFHSQPAPPLPEAAALAVYRAVHECLDNIELHARAQRVTLSLRPSDGGVCVVLEDDGIGFDPNVETEPDELGLFEARDRLAAVGGALVVEAHEPSGTRIVISVRFATQPGG